MHHIISQVHRERVGNSKSAVLFCRLKFTYFALFTSKLKISEPVILVLMYSKRYSSTIHSVSYHFLLDHAEKNVYFFYHKTTILSEYKKEAREHASEFCFFRVTRPKCGDKKRNVLGSRRAVGAHVFHGSDVLRAAISLYQDQRRRRRRRSWLFILRKLRNVAEIESVSRALIRNQLMLQKDLCRQLPSVVAILRKGGSEK